MERRDRFSAAAAAGLAVACALTLAACASASPPSVAPPSTRVSTSPGSDPPGHECAASQLKISLTSTGALAGQAGGYLKFSNQASTPCRITGWPAVTGLTAAGTATPLRHAQSTMFGAWQRVSPLPVLTLQPGQAAYAVVAAQDRPAGGTCPAPYARLRVTPPGGSNSVVLSAWLPGARSDLPSCRSVSGSPTAEISAITPLSRLPH
jgi:uncharacterized protein DUF4232